jgi:hypothetical protein
VQYARHKGELYLDGLSEKVAETSVQHNSGLSLSRANLVIETGSIHGGRP